MNHIKSTLSRVAKGTQKGLDLKRNLHAVNYTVFAIISSCEVLRFTFLKNCLLNRKLLNYILEKIDWWVNTEIQKYKTKQSLLLLNFSVHN